MGKGAFLVALCLWATLAPLVPGQLSTADKQVLLNLHNQLRGSVRGADIVQSVWDKELAETAQSYAEECHFAANPSVTTAAGLRRGENLGRAQGRMELLDGARSSMRAWLEDTQSPSYIQAVWWNVTAIGCGAFQCPRLSLSGGGRVDNASFLVCNYLTVYIADMPPFTAGDECTRCPSGYPSCDSNGLCATSPSLPVVPDDTTPPPTITRRVHWISPGAGSIGGGSRLSLYGTGFSGDQHTGGNEVLFRSGDTVVPCDVQVYYSTATKIVCDTRPTPDGQEWRSWSLVVRVRDGEGADWEEVDTSCCRFQQRFGWTPYLERFAPYAGEPSSLINIYGRIFTVAFDDTPEDPPLDVISRVTVGNRLCNHVNEDGDLYGAALTSNIRGSLTCFTNTSNIIDSMNVSVTLEYRGSSFIPLYEYIIGIDNKLRPYSYQTYAEILSVEPDRGSVDGGTTITITTSVDLTSYRPEEVQVYVGGRECEDLTLTGDASIQCTTPSQPPALPYYPGGRGLRREVWKNPPSIWVLDYFLTEPLSPDNSVHERAYRDSSDPREFGERYNFVQRYTGFFVPPVTSLYTFSIISDDLSRLYLSPTADADDKEMIASAPQHTRNRWDEFESQTSEPMMMERGQYYYMEAYSNNGGGPWRFGISAKVHSLPYTTYPYLGDRERQRIMTTSTILEETHAVSLTVSPSVFDMDILYLNQDGGGACDIIIAIDNENTLALYPDTTTSALQTTLNEMTPVQEVGGVRVERRAGLTEDGYSRVLLRLVFLTGSEVNLPAIEISSSPDNCSNITAGFTQLLTTPTFQLGFPDSARRTRPLLVAEATAEQLQTELETLLSYECSRNAPSNLLVEERYEEEGEEGVDRSRAYCGRQSLQNPSVIWEGRRYQTNVYTHVCFASLGSLPSLRASVHYYTGDERTGRDITFNLGTCPDWPTSTGGGAWQYSCINLQSCLREYDETGQMFQVEQLRFDGGAFWIDEFAISPGRVQVSQTQLPVSPGGVQLSAVAVTGGQTTPPDLLETGNDSLSQNLSFGPIPRLVVSTFQVRYTVIDCGAGMTLIEGDQSDSSAVVAERMQAGTPGITGTFDLSFNGREIRGLPADIAAGTLEQLLEANFPNEGGFMVVPGGPGCEERWWDVAWETREADIPSMTADGTNLVGSDPMVSVVTQIDGGMWLRPLRGDMLRLLELSPQVEVVINSISSACSSQNCSFNYSAEATPLVESLVPSSGQQGTNITLYGFGFQGNGGEDEGVRVWLGEVECVVISVNETEIMCTAQAHSAGSVGVSVHVPGRGYAAVNDSVCFSYRLSLDGAQPARGSTEGGTRVTISGHGYLPVAPVSGFLIGAPLDSSPWLGAGFGWPRLPPLSTLCPSLADQLYETYHLALSEDQTLLQLLLANYSDRDNQTLSRRDEIQSAITSLYLDLPISVLIGSAPCVVTSASIDSLNCTTTSHYDSTVNITVTVLGETAVLENAYRYDDDLTPTVTSISPTYGPVYGGTQLTISGEALTDTTSVVIGDAPCVITSRNATNVECTTTSHAPFSLPVHLSTGEGVARLAMEGSGDDFITREAPFFFTYELEFNSVEPLTGSANGGQQITIEGRGFHPTRTSVLIGGRHGYVVSSNDMEVVIITPSPIEEHTVTFTDGGYSIENGFQFAWSTPNTVVRRGDTVTWEWDLDLPGIEVNVFQTAEAGSSVRLEGGFSSESSVSGSFSYTFPEPGVFHYASELTQQLVVYGQVTVEGVESQGAGVRVIVDGYEAPYVPEDPGSGTMMPGGIQRRQAGGCDDGQVVTDEETEAAGLSFVYSVCNTPTVTSVTPLSGNALTTFTLTGSLLLPPLSSDTVAVQFGGFNCAILSVNESVIECRLDLMQMPPSFSPLPLSLTVPGLGYATTTISETTIELSPIVTSLSPANSSTEGGSHLFISGHGFPEDEVAVTLGDGACEVVNQSYSAVQCVTAGGSPGSLPVTVSLATSPQDPFQCVATDGCSVAYSTDHTPMVVAATPTSLVGPGDITVEISGSLFSGETQDNMVMVGGYECLVTSATPSLISCTIPALPAGSYAISLTVCPSSPSISSSCPGRAAIMTDPLTSPAEITDVSPNQGSVAGSTLLTIAGLGFSANSSDVSVSVGGQECTVSSSNYTTIICTTATNAPGTYDVMVTSHGIEYPATHNYTYSMEMTPVVMSVAPSNGQQGTSVTISGANLGGAASVDIGGSQCEVDAGESNDTSITCMLGLNLAGQHNINVNVDGVGMAMVEETLTFNYDLLLTTFSPTSGSLAGMSSIVVGGMGFNPTDVSASVCGQPCSLSTSPGSLSSFECLLPPMTSSDGGVVNCSVSVESLGIVVQFDEEFTYSEDLTPRVEGVNRTRGGTQGGSRILIQGSGFSGGEVSVTIAGVDCGVLSSSDSEIVCDTGASGRTVRAQLMVFVAGKGFAESENVTFWYVDLWSSRFTWGNQDPPREGEFVVVPRGQTLVLDTVTPVLSYLLVQGGELVFDEEATDDQVGLHTHGMLITSGGRLEVGTEDRPFEARTQIVLYGDVLSTEIPVYGAKTLALRQGSIDIHGKPLVKTWTRLSETATAGSMTLRLQEAVDWAPGGKIVVASTSFSQRENEELTISRVEDEGRTLVLESPLEYDHISVKQTIAGREIDTSAEVGYLTRNIVVRGSVNEEFVSEVAACPEEFRTGQFQLQTCFLGRFGSETLSDQFGSQIMIHAPEQNRGDVFGRFSFVEVTHAGQAFRLGRYPIHFHLNGDVTGSYVRGCSIHHTFNRAVTVHAVDNLLVENNVAYNILGHAYFLEDGIEQNNMIQDNLGIFVRASSSLLNVDITPAVFWMVNPSNTVRRNAAAGGTHFGFWYRLPVNPTGPSTTFSVFPRRLPLGEFTDNSAHSFGWYGLWVFPEYAPYVPAVFNNFLAWKNERGVEFGVEGGTSGALQLHNSTLLDNELAGFEATEINAEWGESVLKDTLIVGHSEVTAEDDSFCTVAGIKTPHSPYLSVESVIFVNFDREGCTAIAACSHCKNLQGGFETRYRDISFIDSPRLTTWQWEHEQYHRDMDGTLTGTGEHSVLVPTSKILPPSCVPHEASSFGVPGSICPGSLDFTRLALLNPTPSASLKFQRINLTNVHGTTNVEYEDKRLLVKDGHMALLPVNLSYALDWNVGPIFTNTSYQLLVTELGEEDYIFLRQRYPGPLDSITVNGKISNVSESFLSDPSQAETGDWFSDENNTINYIITGDEDRRVNINFQTYTCFYEDCIPPPPPTLPPPIPPGRPEVTQSWSDPSIWPEGQLPQEGQDVFVNCSWYLLLDVTIPRLGRLTVCGALEVTDGMDHVIEADIILITGGRLVAGYPDTPLTTSKVTFLLHGNRSSPEVSFDVGPILGSKAMGVFGELILTSVPRAPVWTRLGATVEAGGLEVVLSEAVEWEAGDEIVITSTSFEGAESETAVIASVSGSGTRLTLTSPLQYRHVYETETIGSRSSTIAAEVGLLTRDITIASADSERADTETFGCRVLVGTIQQDGQTFSGSVQLEGVELKGCGQLGYTEEYDPRFLLAVLNINGRGSYVRSSSIHDGYNTGIGVFGSDGFQVTDNVIHNTVGSSVQADGSHLVITGNLASLSQFLATYRTHPLAQPANSLWTANFELASTLVNLTLRGNVAAGGNKAGFHVNGDACTAEGDQLQVADNTAHSTLHGFHLGFSDGHSSGCTHIARFTAHSCFHYAIFSFCPADLRVSQATLVNNHAGIFAAVIGPPSLSHRLGNKQVIIEDSLLVSASPGLDCGRDSVVPETSLHPQAFSDLRLGSPSGAHAGIIIPVFTSGQGHRTLSGWSSISAYPAISGKTTISGVTFANFGSRCPGLTDTLLTTHARSEDCNHPTHLRQISHQSNSQEATRFFNHEPILGSINPSDCVDLDCDGLKHVLVRDEDGSFLQVGGARSLVSMAELSWGENGPRGLGNFRIPTVMLATPGGGMEDADTLFPGKGIVRGTGSHGDESQCSWNAEWNSYVCEGIDHLMIVIESLDDDTEVRRLSPVGLAANGFIDLLNGPMDNGWCGGYTCQERISTFFGIVAAGLNYTMGLTSTNPQNMALHLLNAEEDDAIVVAIFYTNPQRLDVFSDGEYVVPNNAMMLENGNLEYQSGTVDDFRPTLSQSPGANYYDRDSKQLHILLKGDRPYEIRTTPVIQVGLSLEVSVDDFFSEDRLVQNLAFLLGIDSSQIRVVSVVMETITKRKRRQTGSMTRVDVEFEIGNPPVSVVTINTTNTTTPDNETMSNNQTSTEALPTSPALSFEQLEGLTEMLVDVIQTGQLTSELNATVVNAVVMEPEPEPVDPTNGTRATPTTGGPQPTDNGTELLETFSEMQLREEQERQNETEPIVFTIPTQLSVERVPSATATEGMPLSQQPIIVMFDNFGGIIRNLGLEAWRVRAMIERGPPGAFLVNDTAALVSGRAYFSALAFSYPGTYRISFEVVFPESAEFRVTVEEDVVVGPRDLRLVVATQPGRGNTSHTLYPYPAVELWEGGAVLREHSWRNSSWVVRATLQRGRQPLESWERELSSGYAKFTEITVSNPGEYTLVFSVSTNPPSTHVPASTTSQSFYVARHPITRLELTYDEDYDTIIGQSDEFLDQFMAAFTYSFQDTFPSETVEIYNVTVTRGSIVVSVFLTSRSARDLLRYIETVTTSNGTFVFSFRGVELVPSTIVQDPAYPISVSEEEDELTLILLAVIPSATVLLSTFLLILLITLCYRHRRNTQSFKPRTRVAASNAASAEKEGKYVQHNMGALGFDGSEEERYLTFEMERRMEPSMSAVSFQSFEMKEKSKSVVSKHEPVVVSKVISIPGGSVFVNPAKDQQEEEEVGRYVAVPTRGKAAASIAGGIGGLEKEVEEILTKSGSLMEAESHLH